MIARTQLYRKVITLVRMITVLRTQGYYTCLRFPLSSVSHCSTTQGATLYDSLILRYSWCPPVSGVCRHRSLQGNGLFHPSTPSSSQIRVLWTSMTPHLVLCACGTFHCVNRSVTGLKFNCPEDSNLRCGGRSPHTATFLTGIASPGDSTD